MNLLDGLTIFFFSRYKGYIFPKEIIMTGVLKELETFEFTKNDIIVASYPKTGKIYYCKLG